MLLMLQTMGCGRSKQQSPKNGEPDLGINGTKEKSAGRKKKSKGDKKENKDPQKASEKSGDVKTSTPNKSNTSSSLLKPPPTAINGSSQNTLTIDIECPIYKDKADKTGGGGKSREAKDFGGGKQANIKVTHSQIEFFKMLDEKIERGRESAARRSMESFEISTP